MNRVPHLNCIVSIHACMHECRQAGRQTGIACAVIVESTSPEFTLQYFFLQTTQRAPFGWRVRPGLMVIFVHYRLWQVTQASGGGVNESEVGVTDPNAMCTVGSYVAIYVCCDHQWKWFLGFSRGRFCEGWFVVCFGRTQMVCLSCFYCDQIGECSYLALQKYFF